MTDQERLQGGLATIAMERDRLSNEVTALRDAMTATRDYLLTATNPDFALTMCNTAAARLTEALEQ